MTPLELKRQGQERQHGGNTQQQHETRICAPPKCGDAKQQHLREEAPVDKSAKAIRGVIKVRGKSAPLTDMYLYHTEGTTVYIAPWAQVKFTSGEIGTPVAQTAHELGHALRNILEPKEKFLVNTAENYPMKLEKEVQQRYGDPSRSKYGGGEWMQAPNSNPELPLLKKD